MKKKLLLMTTIAALLLTTGCGSSEAYNSESVTEAVNAGVVENATAGNSIEDGGTEISKDDIEVTEYQYDSQYLQFSEYVVVTNHSKKITTIDVTATSYDASGNVLQEETKSVVALAPEETSYAYFWLNDTEDIDRVEYSWTSREEKEYKPVLSDIEMIKTLNDASVALEITNNSGSVIEDARVCAIFLDENDNVINEQSWEICANGCGLEEGYKRYIDFSCMAGEYKDVLVFLSGRESKNADNIFVEEKASDIECKEYYLELDDMIHYFVSITNNSDEKICIWGNAAAKKDDGSIIDVADSEYMNLGKGETSLIDFWYPYNADISNVDYNMYHYIETDAYEPILKDISYEVSEGENELVVDVTNNGEKTGTGISIKVLLFDENDNVINYLSDTISNENYSIMPGETLAGEFEVKDKYDHYEVYLSGSARTDEVPWEE